MAKNYFKRYVWLIDTINRHGHITLQELSRKWESSSVNDDGEPLAERTFHNHRIAIEDTFGIEIKCDRSLGYYISNEDDIERGSIRQWLLESMSLNNLLNETKDMRDRILFEEIPSSKKWLSVIINAMHDGKAIEMTYQNFWRDEPCSFVVHPYCMKLFRQRWYMLARRDDKSEPFIYALDERMINISPTKKALRVPPSFDAKAFFSNYFGIIVNEGSKSTTVEIRVDEDQVKYIKSLPLHASQTIVEETPDYTVFQYLLVPTFDFKQEILSHGAAFKVLSPEWLREEIKEEIAEMANNYAQ